MDEPNLDWTALVADRKIKEAIEAGEFDNLPGKGKPLSDEILSTSAFDRFTSRLIKDAKALPEWLQLEKDIEREVSQVLPARERGLRAIRAAKHGPSRERIAARLHASYYERLDLVNTMVLKYNYAAPASLQRAYRRYKIKEEMASLESDIVIATEEAAAASTGTPSRGASAANPYLR